MKPEQAIAQFVLTTSYKDIPDAEIAAAKKQILTYFGAASAGSSADGCETVCDLYREQGGVSEATILIHGGKIPAQLAAFCNSVMGRALDICDHIQPGLHIGSAVIPAALAAAEMIGGCTGEEFITAVVLGSEIPLRMNRLMTDDEYDGFDPTGICGVYGTVIAAGKLLGLDETQLWNALALGLSKSGTSYQNNIDGSLGVRIMEGWSSQAGLECVKLAQHGITGPKNFLDGVYGFCHLFGRNRITGAQIVEDLGTKYHLTTLNFKKYPSCGLTQGPTEVILKMADKHGLTPEDIDHITLDVPMGTYNLVGKPFDPGVNAKVDAQFSLAYCMANALYRKTIKLSQFDTDAIFEPEILAFAQNKVTVNPSLDLKTRKHYSADLTVTTKSGQKYVEASEVPPGTPKNPLTEEDFRQRYYDCMDYSEKSFLQDRADANFALLNRVETLPDILELLWAFKQ